MFRRATPWVIDTLAAIGVLTALMGGLQRVAVAVTHWRKPYPRPADVLHDGVYRRWTIGRLASAAVFVAIVMALLFAAYSLAVGQVPFQ